MEKGRCTGAKLNRAAHYQKRTDLITCSGGLPGRSLLDLHIKIFQSHTKNKKKNWKKMRIVVKGRPCKYREEEGGKKKKSL